jgi:hypothetical protein
MFLEIKNPNTNVSRKLKLNENVKLLEPNDKTNKYQRFRM